MVYKVSKTDIGARDYQEDSVDIIERGKDTLFVLGDGMGGHSGGSIASDTLISVAREAFINLNYDNPQNFFDDVVTIAHKKIKLYANQSGEDPNSTVAFALVTGNTLHYANIGDSRVYIFDEYGLVTRTRDHSIPEMLFQMGEIKEEEMATHPDQNRITRSLGPSKLTMVTYRDFYFQSDKSYMILLCSDGFWEYVSEYEMNKLFNLEIDDIEAELERLIALINQRAGVRADNISVAIGKIDMKSEHNDNKFWNYISMDNGVF